MWGWWLSVALGASPMGPAECIAAAELAVESFHDGRVRRALRRAGRTGARCEAVDFDPDDDLDPEGFIELHSWRGADRTAQAARVGLFSLALYGAEHADTGRHLAYLAEALFVDSRADDALATLRFAAPSLARHHNDSPLLERARLLELVARCERAPSRSALRRAAQRYEELSARSTGWLALSGYPHSRCVVGLRDGMRAFVRSRRADVGVLTSRGGASGPAPLVDLWPLPKATGVAVSLRAPLGEVLDVMQGAPTLERVRVQLVAALAAAGYPEHSLFGAPGGFVLLTGLERIHEDGTPLDPRIHRFLPPTASAPVHLVEYIRQLFFGPPGYYRMLAFVVTDQTRLEFTAHTLDQDAVSNLRWQGAARLPRDLADQAFSGEHDVYAVVYEFKHAGRDIRATEHLPTQIHLEQAGLFFVGDAPAAVDP